MIIEGSCCVSPVNISLIGLSSSLKKPAVISSLLVVTFFSIFILAINKKNRVMFVVVKSYRFPASLL